MIFMAIIFAISIALALAICAAAREVFWTGAIPDNDGHGFNTRNTRPSFTMSAWRKQTPPGAGCCARGHNSAQRAGKTLPRSSFNDRMGYWLAVNGQLT